MTLADLERKAVKEAGFGICVDVAEQAQGLLVPLSLRGRGLDGDCGAK